MASSLNATPRTSIPWQFCDYLNGLREEFELQLAAGATLMKRTSPLRVNLYLRNLNDEFELMSAEIEALRNENDLYKEMIEVQLEALKLQDVTDSNFICERCSKGTASSQETLLLDSTKDATASSSSLSASQFTPLDIPQVDLDPNFQQTIPPSSTLIHSAVTLTQPSPSSVSPTNAVDPDWAVRFNNQVRRDIEIEMAHVLSHGEPIQCVRFSKDGKHLAAGCSNGKAYIYNVQFGTLTRTLKNLLAEQDCITAVCFSPDGDYLATGSTDGRIYIWNINTKYVRNSFKGKAANSACSLDFSPNGRLLVASDDNIVRLWNMRYGSLKILADDDPFLFLDYNFSSSAVFSPDGRHVAASHFDGIVRVWEVCTGRLMKRVLGHIDWVNDVAFTSDGKGLVSAGFDKTLKYWDVGSLFVARFRAMMDGLQRDAFAVEELVESRRQFLGHKDSVFSVAVSPEGRWVASGSGDKSVRIWDARSAEMQCILDHGCMVLSVDFSPAGYYLSSGGENGVVRIWKYSNSTFGGFEYMESSLWQ